MNFRNTRLRSSVASVLLVTLSSFLGCSSADGPDPISPISETRTHTLPGKSTTLQVTTVVDSDTQQAANLVLSSGTRQLLASDVDYTASSVAVTTFINGAEFVWTLEENDEGTFTSTHTSPTGQLVLVLGPDYEPTPQQIKDWQDYQAASVDNAEVVAAAQTLDDFIFDAVDDDILLRTAVAAKASIDGEVNIPNGPIQDYVDCLRQACTEAGLCYNQQNWMACTVCPSTNLLLGYAASMLYLLGAELCLIEFLKPIKEIVE